MTQRHRSKALATWIALIGGSLGLHRFYLHGWRDLIGWLHWPPTWLGAWGVLRMRELGQDDRLAWALIPLLGLMLAGTMLTAIVYGLTPDDKWNQRYNPQQPARPGIAWLAVCGAVLALLFGGSALMATIAFSAQHFFMWQTGR